MHCMATMCLPDLKDHATVQERDGTKTVYIVLPYYRRGNLQDAINANLVNHTRFPERRLMALMLGVCKALKAMHQYKVRGSGPGQGSGGSTHTKAKTVRGEAAGEDADAAKRQQRQGKRGSDSNHAPGDEAEQPLMSGGEVAQSLEGAALGEIRAYAHRDIKPGN